LARPSSISAGIGDRPPTRRALSVPIESEPGYSFLF
jgi:hypothetical protein